MSYFYAMELGQAMSEFMNRAGRRMYRFYSDLRYDLKKIEELQPNESVFFIVRPSGTHSATPSTLNEERESVERRWGNHIVIKVRRDDKNQYFVENFDKTLTHEWDKHVPSHVIDAYNDFSLED